MSEDTKATKISCCGDEVQLCCKPTDSGLVIEVRAKDPEKARTLQAAVVCCAPGSGGTAPSDCCKDDAASSGSTGGCCG
jgi:hypothetical protein